MVPVAPSPPRHPGAFAAARAGSPGRRRRRPPLRLVLLAAWAAGPGLGWSALTPPPPPTPTPAPGSGSAAADNKEARPAAGATPGSAAGTAAPAVGKDKDKDAPAPTSPAPRPKDRDRDRDKESKSRDKDKEDKEKTDRDKDPGYLKNGDFETGKTSWDGSGKVVPDPQNAGRHALRITLAEGGAFVLSQKLDLPSRVAALTTRFRVRATRALPTDPVQLRVRLLDAKGNSVVVGLRTVRKSGVWEDVILPPVAVGRMRAGFLVEGVRGRGDLFLDDFVLR